jgi:hypothetical protein
MNPLAGIRRCISLINIVFRFSLLVREENLNTRRFIDCFPLNYPKNCRGESEIWEELRVKS